MSAKLKKLKRKEVAVSENEETEDDDDNVLYSLTQVLKDSKKIEKLEEKKIRRLVSESLKF